MTNIGIAHNGPMTCFTLDGCKGGRVWFLCRDDLQRISEGIFSFDDIRTDLELLEDEKSLVVKQAKDILSRISTGLLFADIGQGFYDQFKSNAGKYVSLTTDDLGGKFVWDGTPFVLLGANPKARRFHLVARNLVTGKQYKFSIDAVEKAFGRAAKIDVA